MDKLIIAIVNKANPRALRRALIEKGVRLTELPSLGGFLGRRNTTFMMGVKKSDLASTISTIKKHCEEMSEILPDSEIPSEAAMGGISLATEAAKLSVGGVTIFVLDIDQFEKL